MNPESEVEGPVSAAVLQPVMDSIDPDWFKVNQLKTAEPPNSGKPPIEIRDFQWVTDNQNGNPSGGLLQYDTLTLALASRWIDPSQSYIEVPHYVTADIAATVSPGATSSNALPFTTKAGFPFLRSALVQLGGVSVTANNQGLDRVNNYFLLTQWSGPHTKNLGPLYSYAPDTGYGAVATLGLVAKTGDAGRAVAIRAYRDDNAQPYLVTDPNFNLVTTVNGRPPLQNKGLYDRAFYTCFPATRRVAGVADANNNSVPNDNIVTVPAPAGVDTAAQANAVQQLFYIRYPLWTLSNVFANCGPLRCRIQIYFYFNQITGSTATDTAAQGGSIAPDPITAPGASNNCPIMSTHPYILASAASIVTAASLNLLGAVNIRTGVAGSTTLPSASASRLYLRMITLSQEQEAMVAVKRVVPYFDFNYYSQSVAMTPNAQSTDNQWLIATGIPMARKLVFFNFYGPAGMFNGQSPYYSPIRSEPGRSSPLINFANTRLFVGSRPVSQNVFERQSDLFNSGNRMVVCNQADDDVISSGPEYGYDAFRNQGIWSLDLTKLGLTIEELNNTQIQLQTQIYPPQLAGVPIAQITQECYVLYERVVVLGIDGSVQQF